MKRLYFMNEQGSVLLTSMGLVLVMMAMGICLSKISTDEINSATLKLQKESANCAAETGWAVAARWLQNQVPSVTEDILGAHGNPAHPDHNNLVGELNSTGMPTRYDAEVIYNGYGPAAAYDGEGYTSLNYTIISDGYVSRDLQAKNRDEIKQAGRFTEIITNFRKIKEE